MDDIPGAPGVDWSVGDAGTPYAGCEDDPMEESDSLPEVEYDIGLLRNGAEGFYVV
jgi:hypothetical protein